MYTYLQCSLVQHSCSILRQAGGCHDEFDYNVFGVWVKLQCLLVINGCYTLDSKTECIQSKEGYSHYLPGGDDWTDSPCAWYPWYTHYKCWPIGWLNKYSEDNYYGWDGKAKTLAHDNCKAAH